MKTVRIPSPAAGTGYRVIRGTDGRMTTVPLTNSDVTLYRPLLAMAMDQAMPKYGSGDDDPSDIDLDTPNSAGDDLRDQISQLLAGKVDDASIEMLIKLIEGDDTDTAPAPAAQDRRGRRMGHDQRLVMPSKAEIARRIAASGEIRAQRAVNAHEALVARFPALKNARVA
jgi:hypothetical protein